MALLVVGLLAAATGFVAFHEAAAYVRTFDARPFGAAPATWAAVGAVAGCGLAFFVAPIVVGALGGYCGFRQLQAYEDRNHEPLFGVAAPLGAAACAIFGLFGGLFTPVLLWMFVCSFVGLAGMHLLLLDEKQALLYDRQRLQNENRQLLAARAGRPGPAAAQAAAADPAPAPQAAVSAPAVGDTRRRPLAAWAQPPAPAPDAWLTNFATRGDDHDLLPRRR